MSRAFASLLVAASLPLAAACSGTMEYALVGTPRSPGTDGRVQVEEIEGGNRLVTIHIEHLVPPDRLGDNLTTYVVWFQGRNQQPIKAGQLGYEESNRSGRLTATTPMASFQIKITGERTAEVAAPSEVVISSVSVGE